MRLLLASTRFFPKLLKTYSTGYFSKQQNETGYFCGMSLIEIQYCESSMIRTLTSDRTTQVRLLFHELLQDFQGKESTVPYHVYYGEEGK